MNYDESTEPIGEIDMLVKTADVTNFISGLPGSLDIRYARFTDYSEEQILEISTDEVRALDIGDKVDRRLIKDVASLGKESRRRLSESQLEHVKGLLGYPEFWQGGYRCDIGELVALLNDINPYTITIDDTLLLREKEHGLVVLQRAEQPGSIRIELMSNTQLLCILRTITVNDFKYELIPARCSTFGSPVHFVKPDDGVLLEREEFKNAIEIPPFFLRVVDGFYPERHSKIVIISRGIFGKWRSLPCWM